VRQGDLNGWIWFTQEVKYYGTLKILTGL